ncbi:putative metal-dependent membrane protease [Saprospira grandis DSM 2844]|uniref:Putative metal-dependent membrane protease n=1 Tax=Saprospira grandis DSM 2844 TaxID=694433 RepID=J1I3G5_9BACT|nr:CPBP family intramembrane glutamic endopeptidase [Saprospira grandis]EJF53245.1 putative metal-dependent membrane protease [Saprospira grandis DSM 2844]
MTRTTKTATQGFLYLLPIWAIGMILGQLGLQLIASAYGVSNLMELVSNLATTDPTPNELAGLKWGSLFSHFCGYTLVALGFSLIWKPKRAMDFLLLNRSAKFWTYLLLPLLALCLYPIAMQLYALNQMMTPESWIAKETIALQEKLMSMNSPMELLTNFLLVGLAAGLGEELLFRGILQRLLSQLTKNLDLGIWIAALLFSLIHFQPEGFIPRFLLGALLGYSLRWTGSLWTPILLHIAFNSSQLLLYYYFADQMSEQTGLELPIYLGILAYPLAFAICFLLYKGHKKQGDIQADDYLPS